MTSRRAMIGKNFLKLYEPERNIFIIIIIVKYWIIITNVNANKYCFVYSPPWKCSWRGLFWREIKGICPPTNKPFCHNIGFTVVIQQYVFAKTIRCIIIIFWTVQYSWANKRSVSSPLCPHQNIDCIQIFNTLQQYFIYLYICLFIWIIYSPPRRTS